MKTGVVYGKSEELKKLVRDLYNEGNNNAQVADAVNNSGLIVDNYQWNDKKASAYKIHILGMPKQRRTIKKKSYKEKYGVIDIATDLLTSNLNDKTKEIMLKRLFSL